MFLKASIWKWLGRVFLVDALIAIAVPLLQSLFDQHSTLSILLRQYIFSVIYANLIGLPLCLALPPVWMRSARQPPLLRSISRGVLILLANVIGCLLGGLVLRAWLGTGYNYWVEFRSSLGLALVLSSIVVAFVSMYETQQSKLRNSSAQRERAIQLATEARLTSLESRIHPHFLFNTINSVSSLIHEDPLRAEKILVQLADLLRFSLATAPGGLVPLSRELQIVEDYLEIEKARFGDRLQYQIHVPEEFFESPVPPLSLQTLVENSVKYAVGPRGRGASLYISASMDKGNLRLAVEDNGPGFHSLELPSGHGLNNLEERLRALFGEASRLSIESDATRTTVAFEIP